MSHVETQALLVGLAVSKQHWTWIEGASTHLHAGLVLEEVEQWQHWLGSSPGSRPPTPSWGSWGQYAAIMRTPTNEVNGQQPYQAARPCNDAIEIKAHLAFAAWCQSLQRFQALCRGFAVAPSPENR